MACEYFSSASANCPFLNSRFPSFFSRARGGGRAPHGASRLTVSPAFPPTGVALPLPLWSPWTEAVEPLLLDPLAIFSLESCGTLYLSELPPLFLRCSWWELLDSACGPPSPLPWGFLWAFPMSPLSTGVADLSSPPTGWLGWTRQAGREREGGEKQRRETEKGKSHPQERVSSYIIVWEERSTWHGATSNREFQEVEIPNSDLWKGCVGVGQNTCMHRSFTQRDKRGISSIYRTADRRGCD